MYTDYAYFKKQNHIKILCSEIWAEMTFGFTNFQSYVIYPLGYPLPKMTAT